MTNAVAYKKKINSLDELKKMGLKIIEDNEDTVENRLQEILNEKGLLISDLSKLTGISRQNINAVIRNKMKPSIEFVLKVSYVLGIDKVDGIFTLSENAWVKPYRQERDATVYINMIDMTLVDTKQKRQEIKENGFEYYNVETKELLTKEQHDDLLRKYLEDNLESRIQELRKEILEDLKESGELSAIKQELSTKNRDKSEEELIEKAINKVQTMNQSKSKATEELKDEFNKKYNKIYKKVGRHIEPYVVK